LLTLSIFEDGVPPEFRIVLKNNSFPNYSQVANQITVTTKRNNGKRQVFQFNHSLEDNCLKSVEEIPEPHEFKAEITISNPVTKKKENYSIDFKEPDDHHHGGHNHSHQRLQGEEGERTSAGDEGHGHHGHDHDETFRIKVNYICCSIALYSFSHSVNLFSLGGCWNVCLVHLRRRSSSRISNSV
jgi:hypothetical protein